MKLKKVQQISAIVFILSLAIFFLLNIKTDNEKFGYNSAILANNNESIPEVLIYKPTAIDSYLVKPLLDNGLNAVVQTNGDILYGLSYMKDVREADSVFIMSFGENVVDSFPCNLPPEYNISGVLMVSPTADVEALIYDGVYSCSYLTIAPTLVVQSVSNSNNSVSNSVELYNLLSGDTILYNGSPLTANRGNVSLNVTTGNIISDLPYSEDTLTAITNFINANISTPIHIQNTFATNSLLCIIAAISLLISLIATAIISSYQTTTDSWEIVDYSVSLNFRVIISRAIIIILALVGSLISLFVIPMFNVEANFFAILYIGYLFSLGIITFFLYLSGSMYKVGNKLNNASINLNIKASAIIIATFFALIAIMLALNISGMSIMIAEINIGLLVTILLSILLMYSISKEVFLSKEITNNFKLQLLFITLPFLPLLLPIVFSVPSAWLQLGFALLRLSILLLITVFASRTIENYSNSSILSSILSGLLLGMYIHSNIIMVGWLYV